MNIYGIIVTYNGLKWYDRCFGSLLSSDVRVNIVVVDNASTDSTVAYVKEHFPEIHLIESKENLGFAKANNIGIKYALECGADYVFLLNQDAWVEKNTIFELVRTFEENENVGIASPIHLNGSQSALDYGFANYLQSDFLSDAYMGQLKKYYMIPFVNAAVWMLSRKCICHVGGFDTSLFCHYGEDDNYCQRVIFHEFTIMVNTYCRACHDREQRQYCSNAYSGRELWNDSNKDVHIKTQLADINNEKVNIPRLVKKKKIKLLKYLLLLQLTAVKQVRKDITLLYSIDRSRAINAQIGCHWL